MNTPFVPVVALPPRHDALQSIRRRAGQIRRRRIRTIIAVASVTSAVAAVVATHGIDGTQSLKPTRTPPATFLPKPSREPGIGVRAPSGPGVPGGFSKPITLPSAAEPPLIPAAGTLGDETFPRDDSAGLEALDATIFPPPAPPDGTVCSDETTSLTPRPWTPGPTGWCITIIDSPPTGIPDQWVFGAIMCRMPGSGPGTIANDHLPRIRVYDADGALVFDSRVHTWDRPGQASPRSRTWVVDEDACVMFLSPWLSIDSNGEAVASGHYSYDWDPTDSTFDDWAGRHAGRVIDVHPGVGY